jgi:hypothetical protein
LRLYETARRKAGVEWRIVFAGTPFVGAAVVGRGLVSFREDSAAAVVGRGSKASVPGVRTARE